MTKLCSIIAAVACVLSISGAAHAAFSYVEVTGDGISKDGGAVLTPTTFGGSFLSLTAEDLVCGDLGVENSGDNTTSWDVQQWATSHPTVLTVDMLIDHILQTDYPGGQATADITATLELFQDLMTGGQVLRTSQTKTYSASVADGDDSIALGDVMSLTVSTPSSAIVGGVNEGTLKLTVNGTVYAFMACPPPPDPIPAPGAILLGSLGVGLVGWMRRRSAI